MLRNVLNLKLNQSKENTSPYPFPHLFPAPSTVTVIFLKTILIISLLTHSYSKSNIDYIKDLDVGGGWCSDFHILI